jgi:two-component system chemotaxis response regulator CheY
MLRPDARILIVDDSRMIRRSMAYILETLGYANVVEASDGAEAVAQHRAQRPDLIFLDLVMPNMRGDEVLREIRATDTQTPIIMVSSVAAQSEIDACARYGITNFLIKPIVDDAAIAALSEQLRQLN